MAEQQCEVCGNQYDKTFEVIMAGASHRFDSFECAVQALAPTCETCSVRITGHGIESGGKMFCCAHCAQKKGVKAARDRV